MRSTIPIQVSSGCVVASIQIDLSEELLNSFREELLNFCAGIDLNGIILDLSGQRIMDDRDFLNLRKIVDSAKIMGYPTVLCGFNPEVVASLVLLDVDLEGVVASKNIDDALLALTPTEKNVDNESLEEFDNEFHESKLESESFKQENGENFS